MTQVNLANRTTPHAGLLAAAVLSSLTTDAAPPKIDLIGVASAKKVDMPVMMALPAALHADAAPPNVAQLGTDPNVLHADLVLTDVILRGANPKAQKLHTAAKLAIDDSASTRMSGLMRVAHHHEPLATAGMRRHRAFSALN